MWYQKNNPCVTFMDCRKGTFRYKHYDRWVVEPDVVSEWKDMPFPDNTFDMVIFDPPHIIQKSEKGNIIAEYGKLPPESWRQMLTEGIKQCFRVLKNDGFFILKWCENDKKIDEIIKLCPYPPLFGTKTGKANNNHWIVFIKYNVNHTLEG